MKYQKTLAAASTLKSQPLTALFGISLPGTELLLTPVRTELSILSLSRSYRRFLRHHRRFLRSYCRSLRRSAAARSPIPIVARLTKHHKTLRTTCKTLWNTLKRLWNLTKHSNTRHSMRQYRRSARQHRRSRGVSGNIGAEFPAISAIAELV